MAAKRKARRQGGGARVGARGDPRVYRIRSSDLAVRRGEQEARAALFQALKYYRDREADALRRLLWGRRG